MAKLYWSGDVGWIDSNGAGITVQSIQAALDALNGADLEVELTTLGGDFFQAAPGMQAIRNYKGKKTLWLNGIVASAGTVIAMGFDTIIARPTSMFMIHNAQSVAFGDHNAMREAADLYERMSKTIADEYTLRLGGDPTKENDPILAKVKAWMNAETWFMGQEIVDAGFANAMESDTQNKASSMMLLVAQNQFRERVTMWAKRKPAEDNAPAERLSAAEALIASGSIDKVSAWAAKPGEKIIGLIADDSKEGFKFPIGKDGKVYRSALRSVAARAAVEGYPRISDWASAQIKAIDAKGENRVNKEQVLAWLKDNPGCAEEVAAVMGLKLVTNSATAAIEMKAKLDAENIADPLAEIKKLRGELETVDGDKVKNALDAAFGVEKDAATGLVNDLRVYAQDKLGSVKSTELAAKLEEFKKLPIAAKLASERMDVNSKQNVFGLIDGKKPKVENKVKMLVAGVEVTEV